MENVNLKQASANNMQLQISLQPAFLIEECQNHRIIFHREKAFIERIHWRVKMGILYFKCWVM